MDDGIRRCEFTVGNVIDGHYKVDKVLGEGSFGVVYAVSNPSGNRQALKLLRLWEVHPQIRDGLVKRFDMEYETGQIDSAYLVRSLNHGLVNGNPYIVMELCTGGDLISISERASLNFVRVASDVLHGLYDLHRFGKVHRDLKPENVLLKSDGTFALTDFGISGDRNKRMTECNLFGKPQQIFGTYAYMPPEQLNPKKKATVLPTTDIFSFGVMMYQLLTGVLPFGTLSDESDLVPYLKNANNGEWNHKTLNRSRFGKEWEPMIEGCLRPDFRHRFPDVETVLRYLPQESFDSRIKEKINAENVTSFQTKIVNGTLLRVMQGENYGRVFYLDNLAKAKSSILTIGRKDTSVENDIEITENDSCYISRCHCTLESDSNEGGWVIRDGQWRQRQWISSTNGTYVNSTEVNRNGIKIKPGDVISIGEVKLRVEGY